MHEGYVSRFVSAPDGLKLHTRDYAVTDAGALPVVCLPGLTRTAADFHGLATALTRAETPRRVIAVDYRGRGLSEYDRDPRNYSAIVELADVRAVLTALEVAPAIFIGTSRGGILTMLLAAAQPVARAGAVLNDIGPVIEAKGLARIKSYVGKLPQPRDMADGGQILKRLFDAQFPKLSDDDWRDAAALTWHLSDGRPVLSYDPNLAATLKDVDIERAVPTLWPQFDALGALPVMVIRGLLSDLLSAETVEAMRARHPGLEVVEAPDEGHPPALGTPDMIAKLSTFCLSCDRATRST
ncbi:MAG: alpha/beta hydrolase [Rhizobiales bacterium]|nr:alpha/beta hydrolase [Hyphomicrobiales bacterium]